MVIVTGASDGLGLEVAKLYTSAGKTVVSIARRQSEAAAHNLICNLRNESDIRKAAEEILAMDEPLEAVINCAGVLSVQHLNEITPEEVDRTLDTNIRAPLLLISALIDRIKKDHADIVNVASSVGLKGYSDQAAYGASKWAMRGFSANLQVELKNTPCRVISFCTGGFKSKLFEKATGVDNTEDGNEWMKAADVAAFIKSILDLPTNMEVSEVVINRRPGK